MHQFDEGPNHEDLGFVRMTVGQPLKQQKAAERLNTHLENAFSVRYPHRHALREADTAYLRKLPDFIRASAKVLKDSPVECYEIAEICGLSRKIASSMRRLDDSWDDEFRQNFGPVVKLCIMEVLIKIEAFGGAPQD